MSEQTIALREHLLALLRGKQAHATFDQSIKDLPSEHRGIAPEGLPYTAWQLLEHMRIAQRDILDFSRNEDGGYMEREWPAGYWPESAAPADDAAWKESVRQFRSDLNEFESLLNDPKRDLFAPFPWGDGQTLLREAMLIASHNSYHLGQLVLLRRILGDWS